MVLSCLSRSESLLPPHRAGYRMAFLWTLNLAITCPVLVWNRPLPGRYNTRVFYRMHYYAAMSAAAVAILVTTALYARLFVIAWRHRHAIQALDRATGNSGCVAIDKREAKLILTITGAMIIGMLYVSWMPYIAGSMLLGERNDEISRVLRQINFLALVASAMFNPFLYQWRIPEFHTAFGKLVPCLHTT